MGSQPYLIRSPYPDVKVPPVDLIQLLLERNDLPESQPLFFSPTFSYTFATLVQAVSRFSYFLLSSLNLTPGSTVAFFCTNDVHLPAAFYGVLHARCVVSTVPASASPTAIDHYLAIARPKALVTTPALLKTALPAAERAGIPAANVILLNSDSPSSHKIFTQITSTPAAGQPARRTPAKPSERAFFLFSSGTTGQPKGIPITHANIVSNILQVAAAEDAQVGGSTDPQRNPRMGTKSVDILPAILPLSHSYPLLTTMNLPLYLGVKVIFFPPRPGGGGFDPVALLDGIEKVGVTVLVAVPPILQGIVNCAAPDKLGPAVVAHKLRNIRWMQSAAAQLGDDTIKGLNGVGKNGTRLLAKGVAVRQAYGMTEAGPGIAAQTLEEANTNPGSLAALLPSMTALVIDPETGDPLPPGEAGELLLRGPNMFSGEYVLHTGSIVNSMHPDHPSFFPTGDMVIFSSTMGTINLTSRLKDLIKYNGYQVVPAEIEGILKEHPAVADAVVAGVWNARRGAEMVTAWVIPKAGKGGDAAELGRELEAFVAVRVEAYKRIRGGVRLVEQLPKGPEGKVRRRELVREAEEEWERDGMGGDSPASSGTDEEVARL